MVAFQHDMLLDLRMCADILALQRHHQRLINIRLLRANAHYISHYYKVRDCILKKVVLSLSDKFCWSFHSPFTITSIHTNGTVRIRLANNNTKHLNICHIKLYHDL